MRLPVNNIPGKKEKLDIAAYVSRLTKEVESKLKQQGEHEKVCLHDFIETIRSQSNCEIEFFREDVEAIGEQQVPKIGNLNYDQLLVNSAIEKAEGVQNLARIFGYEERTVHRWKFGEALNSRILKRIYNYVWRSHK